MSVPYIVLDSKSLNIECAKTNSEIHQNISSLVGEYKNLQ